ncbi:hypothetical protein E2C01_026388 [Portunus trituberculatus]|uniref:Uncharacterized protein n=1 Tax=Portunus trituberculatus TaxID=210409 RepID=A0A5B7EIQ8_PORTR|nr:hypothetical protein [Portunus trituberculatus]
MCPMREQGESTKVPPHCHIWKGQAEKKSTSPRFQESRIQVVLLACKEDMISPAFSIESADLKMVDSRWSQAMVGSNDISFLASCL